MLDRFHCPSTEQSPEALLRIHHDLGSTAFLVTVAACVVIGFAIVARDARLPKSDHASTPDPLSADPKRSAAETAAAAREASLKEQLAKLEQLERTLRTANAQQIVALYHQLQNIALDSFGLTDIEKRIAIAAVSGESTPNIAKACALSESMVKHHLSVIFKKTDTASRGELREKVQRMVEGGRSSLDA